MMHVMQAGLAEYRLRWRSMDRELAHTSPMESHAELAHDAQRTCPRCEEELPVRCFRSGARVCSWCAWSDAEKRANARWRDIRKRAPALLRISLPEFVAWYVDQPDCCTYCGLTIAEVKRLRLKTAGGYFVSWDIDRIDPTRGYASGNLALSCFACNRAKGSHLTAEETRVVGQAMRRVWDDRLDQLAS
jgi:5-methylcytosine-specific restriction endonuclease McrA